MTTTPEDRRGTTAGLVVWLAVIAVAIVWPAVFPIPERSGVHAAPFYGSWRFHDLVALLPAVVAAGVTVWWWPVLCGRLADRSAVRPLAVASGLASVGWAALLAVSGGLERLWSPLESRHGYLEVGYELDAGTFLRTFVERVERYPIHVKGHPPGLPLVLRGMDSIGLGGAPWAAVLVAVVWAGGVAAVVTTVDVVGGRDLARRVSAPVAFLPGVVFAGTTFDALYTGLMAIALSALVVATYRNGRLADGLAVAAGATASFALHLSYGLAPLALIAVVVLVVRRHVRAAILATVGGLLVVAGFVAGGFWWLDGLNATRGFYAEGISRFRPYAYFVFAGNPAAFALAVGPAAAAGFGALAVRRGAPARSKAARSNAAGSNAAGSMAAGSMAASSKAVALLAVPALVAVAAADLTGLSNAEIERIWLPFMPWVAVAAGLVWHDRVARRWLAVTLSIAIVLQAALVTPW